MSVTPEAIRQMIAEKEAQAQPVNPQQLKALIEEKENAPGIVSQFGTMIKKAFTGEDRETESTRALPEIGTGGLLSGEDKASVAKFAAALPTLFDPKDIAKTLRANFPNIGIIQDEKGNLIAANNKTGAHAVLNKPGMSKLDLAQMIGIGSLFTPAASAGGLATSTMGKMAAVGTTSAATQTGIDLAQQAAGRDDNVSLSNVRGTDVAIAGIGGAAFEGIFQGLAQAFPIMREQVKTAGGKITDKIRESFKKEAKSKHGIDPDDVTDDVIIRELFPETAGLQGEKEFGVQLTKGQRSQNQKQLRLEDDILSGRAGGDNAQQVMINQREKVAQQARDAANKIQESLGGETIGLERQAGELVKEGVRAAEQAELAVYKQSLDAVGDAALKPDAFKNLFVATRNAIKGLDFPKDPKIAPATNALLKQIKSTEKFFNQAGVTLKPQHLKQIDNIRKTIGKYIEGAGSPTDKRNMIAMKKAYDDFLDKAVEKALFEGDEQALSALKESRGLFAEYASKYRRQVQKTKSGATIPDKPGQVIEQIVEANPTDQEIVNTLFGAGSTFGKDTSVKMASRFKEILGEGSDGWNAVRQVAFKRLIKTMPDGKTISGQKSLTAFDKAMKTNSELLETIFSKDEIATIGRFINHVKRTQPEIVKGSANPSGSGKPIMDEIKRQVAKLTEILGFSTGNPVLVIAGKGAQVAGGLEGAAKEAVRPFGATINVKPRIVGAATGATLQAVNQ